MRIRPLCYAGVLGSVSEDHASRAIRQARCSPEEARLCEYDTLRSLHVDYGMDMRSNADLSCNAATLSG